MRKAFLLIKICFISLFLLPSCNKKCDQTELANLRFTPDDININPYSGNEYLTFKDLAGDSIFFIHGKRESSSFTHYQINDDYVIEHNHGCRGNYFTDETNKTSFQTDTKTSYPSEISIEMGFIFSFSDPTPYKYIYFDFYDNQLNTEFMGACFFTNDSLFNSNTYNLIYAYHNQISIGPKTFNNVYELHGNNSSNDLEYYTTAYYSFKKGFCGFKSNFGKILYLDKKVN